MNERFKAIVLKKIKWGESDLILHLFTETGEKRAVIAKGALRSRKRFGGGVLEPFHLIGAEVKSSSDRHSEKLALLLEAELLEDFLALRSQFEKIQLGAQFLMTVSRVTREGDHPDARIFELLGHSLKALTSSKNLHLLNQVFDVKLLWLLGVLPLDLQVSPLLRYSVHDVDQIETDPQTLRLNGLRIQETLERVVEDGRSE